MRSESTEGEGAPAWRNPLPLTLRPTQDAASFAAFAAAETGLPLAPHPGAFGVQRRHHVHEGIDLYALEGTQVFAVEDGLVVAVLPFTGPSAGLPWWLDTQVVLVEGASGVVAYGEVTPCVDAGVHVSAGQLIGRVARVLRHDKGRPTSMLHLELHARGARCCPPWNEVSARPWTLQDPTALLLSACG